MRVREAPQPESPQSPRFAELSGLWPSPSGRGETSLFFEPTLPEGRLLVIRPVDRRRELAPRLVLLDGHALRLHLEPPRHAEDVALQLVGLHISAEFRRNLHFG